MSQERAEGRVSRVLAYVELASNSDEHAYGMTVTLAAALDDGRRVAAVSRSFGFGGPRKGVGAIWYRYRGPQLGDDPEEQRRLLNETYCVGLPDIEDAINQMLGRDPEQHRPPRLSWGHLIDVLATVGITMTEEELIALPLDIELSDQVMAEIGRD